MPASIVRRVFIVSCPAGLLRALVEAEPGEGGGRTDEPASERVVAAPFRRAAEPLGRLLDRGLDRSGVVEPLGDEQRGDGGDVGRGLARALEAAVAERV